MQNLNKRTVAIGIMALTVLIISIVGASYLSLDKSDTPPIDTSNTTNSQSTRAMYESANQALRSRYKYDIPYDRPMQLEGGTKDYSDGWFTATITLLDENPENYDRTMVYIFNSNGDDLKVVDFQPSGWFELNGLSEEVPDEVAHELLGEPHGD